MRTTNFLVVLVCFAIMAIALTGCGGCAPGPVTAGNFANDYPPRVRGVNVNAEASMVVVDYQPYDAKVKIQGWTFIPQQGGQSRRNLQFQNNEISGQDNMTGRANFILDGSYPIEPGRPTYFLIKVTEIYYDGDVPRQAVQTYKFEDGQVIPLS